jgi:hypothetical protein
VEAKEEDLVKVTVLLELHLEQHIVIFLLQSFLVVQEAEEVELEVLVNRAKVVKLVL